MSPATLVLVVFVLSFTTKTAEAFNITTILSKHPDFSSFNHYLTLTRLAAEINRRRTITVLAVDNSAMSDLLSHHYSILTLRHILSLHVLTDYFGANKLRHATTRSASLFQSSGYATGTSGYINITKHSHGKTTFVAGDADDSVSPAELVGSIKEVPYDLSILQVTSIISSVAADAPVPSPPPLNLTTLLSSKSCKAFSDLLLAHPNVLSSFNSYKDIGLTVFCPSDSALKSFAPKFDKLNPSNKDNLLLYHALPSYYSLQLLKSSSDPVETLATASGTSSHKFRYTVQNDAEVVRLQTTVDSAAIVGTLLDEDPAAVYRIDRVLEPREMFKAPAPAAAVSEKGKGGDDEQDDSGDEAADQSVAVAGGGGGLGVVMAGMAVVFLNLNGRLMN